MLGAEGGALEAAVAYFNVVFPGNVLLWVMNALASARRGTDYMLVPAGVVCFGVILVVPLSP
jgi:Na+-driven multidrug efflux pump